MHEELVEDKLKTHDKRLNDHAKRIDQLEQNDAKKEVQINNLIKSIDTLVMVLKGLITVIGGCLVTFFFYAIQNHIFK
ncbi:hemolysin XhlA family protein [Clostridium perfringens]|uniref:hemolysin XhlA family protein n=1 Tax=Clostridium perfringens TaxID=1502 RepID=UPI000D7181F1|nr:hemolysin XhlA family protein [Clostridium perfringens]MBO3322001.1 hemolysin XhlA family protein [Clostridium perfringens]MBO3331056.1 hemolysin XhlA family protein [Clostridium perfringens]MDM0934617.1 hemolysin XhlA family protein [Clostridium perfringens]NGS97258.1 hypothetical protein [Clostridium perfringens]PWW95169.1 hypothetical protein CYK76_13655 [Clostridium perfringens]